MLKGLAVGVAGVAGLGVAGAVAAYHLGVIERHTQAEGETWLESYDVNRQRAGEVGDTLKTGVGNVLSVINLWDQEKPDSDNEATGPKTYATPEMVKAAVEKLKTGRSPACPTLEQKEYRVKIKPDNENSQFCLDTQSVCTKANVGPGNFHVVYRLALNPLFTEKEGFDFSALGGGPDSPYAAAMQRLKAYGERLLHNTGVITAGQSVDVDVVAYFDPRSDCSMFVVPATNSNSASTASS